MTLSDVTRPSVLAAVAEFDRLSRDEFLRTNHFGRANTYFLELDGHLYDSKAIAGYAHGISTGVLLLSKGFTGGEQSVAHRLETLGFRVLKLPKPDWTREEIILACELVEANGWKQLDGRDPRVQELSALLQSGAIHPAAPRNPDFRNPAGVARKTHNIVSTHPDFRGTVSHGNQLDEEVLGDFLADPARMHAAAAQVRELLTRDLAGSDDLPDVNISDSDARKKRAERREQVGRRVEGVLGKALREVGPDYVLPDGRLVAIYYSKVHVGGATYLGVKNRIKDDDILVLLLGDEATPAHLVFPRAEALLRYRESFSSVGNDRVVPPIHVSDGSYMLRRPSRGLEVLLDDRVDAYHELLNPPDQADAATTPIGRNFTEDDENVVPRAAAPGLADPDLVERGTRAHRRTRNALAAHLKSLGIEPLDPAPTDPPFDLAWWKGSVLYVAEVKSLTRENEEHQLRLGLGQLLRYCHLLRKRAEHVIPVLAPELGPRDPEWEQLCKALNATLAFPPDFEVLTDEMRGPSTSLSGFLSHGRYVLRPTWAGRSVCP
jgi:5-methylcytosine-specific restriction protein A